MDIRISYGTISKLERGIQGTSIDNVALISEYYGTTLDYIINGTDIKGAERINEMLEDYSEEKIEKLLQILKLILELS